MSVIFGFTAFCTRSERNAGKPGPVGPITCTVIRIRYEYKAKNLLRRVRCSNLILCLALDLTLPGS